jgi:hypothetical protein
MFGWSVPYRDLAIRPHDSLKSQGEKMFRVLRRMPMVPSNGTKALPISNPELAQPFIKTCLRDVRQTDCHRQR